MYAQLTYFDGPRSAELVAANDRAGRERILPAIKADPVTRDAMVGVYVLRQPDGAEVVVTLCTTEEALLRGQDVIRGSVLLPGEDPALLPGPDRAEIFEVVFAEQMAGQPS